MASYPPGRWDTRGRRVTPAMMEGLASEGCQQSRPGSWSKLRLVLAAHALSG